jgi:hypothetical protein
MEKKLKSKIADIKSNIGRMSKDKANPFFKSKYFDLNQILDNLKPLEEAAKISITQPMTNVDGKPALALVIEDLETDETIREVFPMPDIQDPQKVGACVTYYRRFQLSSFFELQAEDDDGNTASGKVSTSGAKSSNNGSFAPNSVVKGAYTTAQSKKVSQDSEDVPF